MSFKILQKIDATIDELTAAYVAIEAQTAELDTQKQTAYSEMVDCQQTAMGGDAKAPARLKKAKDAFQDLQLQVDAAGDALGKIRARIEHELPGFFQRQVAKLEAERKKLQKRRDELKAAYIDKCAEAALLNEQMRGKQFIHLPNSGESRERTPAVNFYPAKLTHEDSMAFLQAIERHRAAFQGNVHSEIDTLNSKRERLEKSLMEGDFPAQTEQLINAKRPKAPEPEPEQVRGRPTTTGRIVDYDALKVEY